MTSKSVSANIRSASVSINLPSREKSYLNGERRKRRPIGPSSVCGECRVDAISTCQMRTNFAPGSCSVRGRLSPSVRSCCTSSRIRAWEYPRTEGRVPLSILKTKRRSVRVGWRLKRRIKRSTMHERTMTAAAKMLESVTGLWEPAGRGQRSGLLCVTDAMHQRRASGGSCTGSLCDGRDWASRFSKMCCFSAGGARGRFLKYMSRAKGAGRRRRGQDSDGRTGVTSAWGIINGCGVAGWARRGARRVLGSRRGGRRRRESSLAPNGAEDTLYGSPARATSDEECSQLGSAAAYSVLEVRQKGCWPMLYGSGRV
jgi:hypothetical protein